MDRRSMMLLGLAAGASLAATRRAGAAGEERLAIDVALEPDEALGDRARALNARLRARDARGFALDATHLPHVTLVQQFVRQADQERVAPVLQQVLQSNPVPMQLRLTGVSAAPWNGDAMLSLDVERGPALSALQEAVLAALIPFVAARGDASAFVRDPPDTAIDGATQDYVSAFALKHSGENYMPHVTAGLASKAVAAAIVAERFEPVSGAVARLSLFQLGNACTARRRLWSSPLSHGVTAT